MRLKALTLAVLLPGILSLSPGVVSGAECPPDDSAKFEQDSIHLRFGSTIKPASNDRYYFERCVTSEDDKIIFVDWHGANIRTWVSKNQPARDTISSRTNKSEWVPSTAFLGLRRIPKRVFYQRSEEEVTIFDKLLEKLLVETRILLWAPTDSKYLEKTMNKIDATFKSEVVQQDDSTYLYTYSWVNVGVRRPFLWESETIQSHVEDVLLIMEGEERKISFRSTSPPAYSVGRIEIYDNANLAVARGSVAIHHPNNFRD